MKEILIGSIEQLVNFPFEVRVDRHSYFLIQNDDGYKLMSRVCPHAGYTLEFEEGEFVCPLHGWTFETDTGRCQNVQNVQLEAYKVVLRDGALFAQML